MPERRHRCAAREALDQRLGVESRELARRASGIVGGSPAAAGCDRRSVPPGGATDRIQRVNAACAVSSSWTKRRSGASSAASRALMSGELKLARLGDGGAHLARSARPRRLRVRAVDLGLGGGETRRQRVELARERRGGTLEVGARRRACGVRSRARRRAARSRAVRSIPWRSSCTSARTLATSRYFTGSVSSSSVDRPSRGERARRARRESPARRRPPCRVRAPAASSRPSTTRTCTMSSPPSRARSARPTRPPSSSATGSTYAVSPRGSAP